MDIKIKETIENYKQNLKEFQKMGFNNEQIREIYYGLEAGVDVSKYADPKFSWVQMFEIRTGLENGVNVDKYADPKFNWQQMIQIREELEKEKTKIKEPELEI